MDTGHLMRDTVTIASEAGYADGKPSFGSQTTIKARVEHQTKFVRGPGGQEVQSDHQFATESTVKTTDRVWLPGDTTSDNTAARRPIIVKQSTTLDGGYTYTEVYL